MSRSLCPKDIAFLDERIAVAVARAIEAHEKKLLEKQALRPDEAARLLGMSISTLRQAIWDGSIAHFRIGKVIRIPKSAIDALLNAGGHQ